MHFFFIIAGVVLLLLFWRAFAALAIVVAVVGGIALLIAGIANQPAVPTAQQLQEMQARQLAAKAQADAQVIAHEAARPSECRNWVQPTPVVDTNGTSWLGRANLEHATRCQSWEANAAAVVSGTIECHRLPASWNYTVGLYQDEVNARTKGSWCVIPANPWPAEREALMTAEERAASQAAAARAAAVEQVRLQQDFRWSERLHQWVEPCESGRIHLMLGSPDTLNDRDAADLRTCVSPEKIETARKEHACWAEWSLALSRPGVWESEISKRLSGCMVAAHAGQPARGVDAAQ
jgi:hypothetical protein